MHWVTEVKTVPDEPKQARTVFVSAGHSNRDPGAGANNMTEADVVLEFRNLISRELADQGIRHLTDGEGSENLPLREAVALAAQADIAVEFHLNAGGRGATGVETLSKPYQYPLGERLCSTVADVLGISNRGAKPQDAGKHSRLAFADKGEGILLELFFVTNKRDIATYMSGKKSLANEIAKVIAEAARQ